MARQDHKLRGGWRPYLTQRVGSGAREAATSKTKARRLRHSECEATHVMHVDRLRVRPASLHSVSNGATDIREQYSSPRW